MDEFDGLHDAAQQLRQVMDRVGADGGVVAQLVDGTLADTMTVAQRQDLAEVLRVTAERVRYARASVPDLTLPAGSAAAPSPENRWLPLNRKERFYTGTILPMLVASDGFAHLHRLLALCGLEGMNEVIHGTLDGNDDITFFTEYGFAESVFTAQDRASWPEVVEADTPDVVIAGPDWLLAIEAKMFHNPNHTALEAQMRRQAVLVDLWASKHGLDPTRVSHVLLLPQRLATRVGSLAYPVVSWEQVLDAYTVVGPRYWSRVLATAVSRHGELESRMGTGGANAEAVMTGKEIAEQHADGVLAFDHVGRKGGAHGTAFSGDVATGNWRTVRYEVRAGTLPGKPNWFSVTEFLTATASKMPNLSDASGLPPEVSDETDAEG